MSKGETVFTRTDWVKVNVEQFGETWCAEAVKPRPNGEGDQIIMFRKSKDAACAALLAQMKHIDGEDRRAAKRERDNAALGAALMATRPQAYAAAGKDYPPK